MKQWVRINNVSDYKFICLDSAKQRIVELFDSNTGKTYIPDSINDYWYVRWLAVFCNIDFYWLQYNSDDPDLARGVIQQVPVGYLPGYKGLEIVDTFVYGGFNLPRDIKPEIPEFDADSKIIDELFEKTKAQFYKTVLISPFTSSLTESSPPSELWQIIINELINRGYSVLTNCAANEEPLPNAKPILVPYRHIVPFLDAAGGFIGLRSGLCDIISTTKAKKIILHPYEAKYWPDGTSLKFTGLNHMGLCDDAIEFEAAPAWGNWEQIASDILRVFSQ
jgi:hypothetical protein